MTEGYAALLISIFRRVGPEEAFIILSRIGEERKINCRLTDADYEEIRARRLAGETWREIGARYGRTSNNMQQNYHNYKSRMRGKKNEQ